MKQLFSRISSKVSIITLAAFVAGCETVPSGTSSSLYNVNRALGPQAIVLDISGSMGDGAGDTLESSVARRAVNQVDRSVGRINTGSSLANGILNSVRSDMFDSARQQTTKIAEAQRQIIPYIRGIPDGTAFDMIAFNASQMRAGGTGASISSAATRASAINFVQSLDANGGTELSPAISLAVSGGAKTIYLVTDGQSTDSEATVLQTVQSAAAQGITINTIGIGQDQNKPLLRQIASMTGGQFVSRGNSLSIISL